MKSSVLTITSGIVGILVGMGLIMPAVAKWRLEGSLAMGELMLLAIGVGLTLGGGTLAFRAFTQRRA